MPNPYNMYNPYYPAYNPQMPIQQPINGQIVQNLSQTVEKTAQCYFVSDIKDMEKVKPNLNVLYVGLNTKTKEIYIKQLNNDGTVSNSTYSLKEGVQEKSDLGKIIERLDRIETKMKGEANATNHNATTFNGATTKPSSNADVQSNDEW